MTGSSTNITIITIIFAVSIALFGFVLAFLISSILTKDQVAADKRLDELKKNEGDSENYALVKHESRIKAKNKEKKNLLIEEIRIQNRAGRGTNVMVINLDDEITETEFQ